MKYSILLEMNRSVNDQILAAANAFLIPLQKKGIHSIELSRFTEYLSTLPGLDGIDMSDMEEAIISVIHDLPLVKDISYTNGGKEIVLDDTDPQAKEKLDKDEDTDQDKVDDMAMKQANKENGL